MVYSLVVLRGCNPNQQTRIALTLFPITIIPMVLVGGLFLNVSDIPVYFIWLQWVSVYFYAFVVAVINQFEGQTFYCDSSELVGGVCPITTGSEVIDNRGFGSYSIWMGFLGLAVGYVVLRLLALIALWMVTKTKSAV